MFGRIPRHDDARGQHVERQMRGNGAASLQIAVRQIGGDTVRSSSSVVRRRGGGASAVCGGAHVTRNQDSRNHQFARGGTKAPSWTRRLCSRMPAMTRSANSRARRPAAPSTSGRRAVAHGIHKGAQFGRQRLLLPRRTSARNRIPAAEPAAARGCAAHPAARNPAEMYSCS